jgi:hypothetical protein
MTSASQIVESLNNQFFHVTCNIVKVHGEWKGEIAVTRKDTDEEVPVGAIAFGKDKERVENELYSAMEEKTTLLATSPPDWNSNVRKVLVHLQNLSNNTIFFASNFDKQKKKDTDAIDDFFHFCKQLKKDTVNLVKNINALSSQERIDLLTISDECLQGDDNPFTIESESSLRIAIFDYFINPTAEEIKVYKENRYKVENYADH